MVATQADIITEIDLPEGIITYKSDGIMYVYFKSNTIFDIKVQLRFVETYKEMTGGKAVPFLFWSGESVTVTKEARENSILIEESSPCKATAVVVNNLASKLVANFYLQFNKPKRPYKVFNSQKDALAWLKQFL